MRLPTRTSHPRHLAGAVHPVERPVRDNLEPPGGPLLGIDIDIDAPIAWDEADAKPRARVARSRIAFAVSITLAALPVLVLDNFPATADTGADDPAATADDSGPERDLDEPLHGTIELDDATTLVTVAPPTVYVAAPPTTLAAAPATTAPPTTAAPTTTVAPRPKVTTTTAAPVATTVAPAPPTTAAARKLVSPDPNDPATWEQLARCESNSDWSANTGNNYYGGLQFSLTTWEYVGGTGYPHEASKATQIEMGKRLQARSGWAAWPGCSRKLGWG